MKRRISFVRRLEFEYRIFISFSIVAVVSLSALYFFPYRALSGAYPGYLLGWGREASDSLAYVLAALVMIPASLLRMWAGSILTSRRMMRFRVQCDQLIIRGPYRLVRNPLYLSDFIAFWGFSLVLPPLGLFLPLLLLLHYGQIIRYEEQALLARHVEQFRKYMQQTNRILPGLSTIKQLPTAWKEFLITRDGLLHNALYVTFIPGFLWSAHTHQLIHALLLGLPAVALWTWIHIRIGVEKESTVGVENFSGRTESKVMKDILYAQCWEDPQMDREAFKIQPDDVVFSITSGGDNLLTFLLDDPAKIIALDVNPYQNYLLEFKMAAFLGLSYDELLELLGVKPSHRRSALYQKIYPYLSPEVRSFWDAHPEKIKKGILHCGRYEKYMRLLRQVISLLMGKSLIRAFYRREDSDHRLHLYQRRWENWRWKFFTQILLSRRVMSLLFDRAFFAYIEDNFSFGEHFAKKAKYALTQLPLRSNYFLSYILLGNYFDKRHLPPYLQPQNYSIIRSRLNRIRIVTDSCEHYFSTLPNSCISKFNFTNIFEWMSPEAYADLLQETIRIARPGGILTYRNLLVRRERPSMLADQIRSHKQLAHQLHKRDLSFIYNNYVVEEIVKKENSWATRSSRLQTAVI